MGETGATGKDHQKRQDVEEMPLKPAANEAKRHSRGSRARSLLRPVCVDHMAGAASRAFAQILHGQRPDQHLRHGQLIHSRS